LFGKQVTQGKWVGKITDFRQIDLPNGNSTWTFFLIPDKITGRDEKISVKMRGSMIGGKLANNQTIKILEGKWSSGSILSWKVYNVDTKSYSCARWYPWDFFKKCKK